MPIDDLIGRLAQLPGAHIGRGPQHPTDPAPELADNLEAFLAAYPQLRADAGYVEFLQRYAGVMITDDDADIGIDIMGFDPGVANLAEFEGAVVDDDGFAQFAMCTYGSTEEGHSLLWEYDFSFDTTGARAPGVYARTIVIRDHRDETRSGIPTTPHAASFTDWLTELVALNGRYPRPTG